MISTFQEIAKMHGWKIGEMTETNLWMGSRCIRHINRIMLIECDKAYIESDKYIDAGSNEAIKYESNDVFTYKDELVNANTLIDAITDAKMMIKILGKKKKVSVEKIKDAILRGINIIQDSLCGYSENSEAVKQLDISNDDEFEKFRCFLDLAGFDNRDCSISEDVVDEIRRIFHQHGFMFIDTYNNDIQTWVNLDKALSVETNLQHNGEDCIRIDMPNNKVFYVFKDADKDLYLALENLYGQY